MKIIRYDLSENNNIDELNGKRTAVAIGKFDGVHLGHEEIIGDLISKKTEGLSAVIVTFEPYHAEYFGTGDFKYLSLFDEKADILEKAGIDFLILLKFNEYASSVAPEDFIKNFFIEKLNMAYIAAGPDLSFGKKGLGNIAMLESHRAAGDYDIRVIPKLCDDGTEISSSLIRKLIEDGDVNKAGKYLGYSYSFSGEVIKGRHLGSSIGFPTINLKPDDKKVIPKYGVYYSTVLVDGKEYLGLTNVGVKPTVGSDSVLLETYIYDFDRDIYGQTVTVSLREFKRPEKKFESVEELKKALANDIEEGKNNQKAIHI